MREKIFYTVSKDRKLLIPDFRTTQGGSKEITSKPEIPMVIEFKHSPDKAKDNGSNQVAEISRRKFLLAGAGVVSFPLGAIDLLTNVANRDKEIYHINQKYNKFSPRQILQAKQIDNLPAGERLARAQDNAEALKILAYDERRQLAISKLPGDLYGSRRYIDFTAIYAGLASLVSAAYLHIVEQYIKDEE